jgi:GWxTD domain-containing protein
MPPGTGHHARRGNGQSHVDEPTPEVGVLKRRNGLWRLTLLGLWLIASPELLGCAALGRRSMPERLTRPFFEAEVLTGIGDRGQSVATVSVSIPYRSLVFFREATGFVSSYRIRAVQVDPRGSRALREWRGRVEVADYETTKAPSVARTTMSLDLTKFVASKDGENPRLEIIVEIDRTSRHARRTLPLRLNAVEPGTLALGELALYRQRDAFKAMPAEVEVMGRALPDPELFRRQEDGRFDIATGEPWLFIRIFDLRGDTDTQSFDLDIAVRPATTQEARYDVTIPAARQGYVTSLLLRLPASAFVFGLNDIDVGLADVEPALTEVSNGGLDLTDDDSWQSSLSPLEEIATDEEFELLRRAAVQERHRAWWEFWDRLDPDLSTPENERLVEHFRRVRYARRQLVDGFGDGATSDRGKLYIRLGPPDTIDKGNSRFDSFATYQVWRYRDAGLVYYFQDSTGSGHFRLVWWEEE